MKVSYCCVENMEDNIRRHNAKILKSGRNENIIECNCRDDEMCPMDGNCKAESIVYEATVKSKDEEKKYIGICATDFKRRFNNHTASFRHEKKKKSTELSKYVWELKEKKADFKITWKILARAAAYRNGAKQCDLCLTEKFIIATADRRNLINKRSELVSKCRHINKFLLYKC